MEIEIRAKLEDLKITEQKVIGLGAKLVKKKDQTDKYFGEINLFKKTGYSFLMRVRIEGDKNFLTYKGAESKKDGVWQEYEFPVDNAEDAENMLKAIGLDNVITVKKNRTEYKLDDFAICLDIIDGLGSFVEIESQNDNDIDKINLNKLMQKLNIKEEQIIHKGYVTLLLVKNNSPYAEYIVN